MLFVKNNRLLFAVLLMSMLSGVSAAILEEVIVTAQKREQSLEDVPISISVIEGENLQNYRLDNMFDLANFVPGMVFSQAPDDGLSLTLRSIGAPARNQSLENAIALFMDGMFVGKNRLYPMATFDLERIEIIQGTQSTLLGKNTSLGAFSMTTRKPGDEFAGDIKAGYEVENGGYSFDVGVDIPISDTFAVRAAVYYLDADGGITNSATGNEAPADDNLGIRLTGVWEVSDNFNATLSYQYNNNEQFGDGNQIIADPNNFVPFYFTTLLGVTDPDLVPDIKLDERATKLSVHGKDGESVHNIKSHIVNLTLNWDIEAGTFTSISSYNTYDLSYADDFDFHPQPFIDLLRTEDYEQFTQEVRFASGTGNKVDYLVGAFYFYSDWTSVEDQSWLHGAPPPVPPAPVPDIQNGPFVNNFLQDTESWSLFGSLTYHLSNRVRITGGLRYSDDSKDILFGRTARTPLTPWNLGLNPPFPPTPIQFEDDFLNGNVNVQFDVNDDIMVYGSYAVGSKAGGVAESTTTLDGIATNLVFGIPVEDVDALVDTETATTYELGMKARLAGGTATVNAAFFYTDVEDLQETVFFGNGFANTNANAESIGIDVSGRWQASEHLSLNGGLVYADAENTDQGTRLAQSPKITANLNLLYANALGSSGYSYELRGNFRYRSSMFNQSELAGFELTVPKSDALTTLDLGMSLISPSGKWQLAVMGRNIFNELEQDFAYVAVDVNLAANGVLGGSPNAARAVWIEGSYSF